MDTYEEEKQRNVAAYERLKDEIRTRYRGQYVAIADGRLIKVSPSFEEADEAVKHYRHRFVFPAGDEPIMGPLRIRRPRFERFLD